jgi:hypothetical protein
VRVPASIARGLKTPWSLLYGRSFKRGVMVKRAVIGFGLVAILLVLDGCTKCGPIWDDWTQSPKSCRSDRF